MNRDLDALAAKSRWLRRELFEMVVRTKKGHVPSSYSCAEIAVALFYGGILRVDPKNPRWPDRDSFIVSKGHAAMVAYPILADLGFFPREEILKFTKPDGILRQYADPSIPGVETVCGSLGHGFTIGAGLALAAKMDGRPNRSWVVVSDGECYEGSVWETAMFAAHHELDNLVALVDRNGLCILERTENCVRLEPLEEKWKAFGWDVWSVDGHSFPELFRAFDEIAAKKSKRPSAVVARTVKGKGISFMEDRAGWHNRMPTEAEIEKARRDLEAAPR
jgi:transketolase